jgi:hypothetical protein
MSSSPARHGRVNPNDLEPLDVIELPDNEPAAKAARPTFWAKAARSPRLVAAYAALGGALAGALALAVLGLCLAAPLAWRAGVAAMMPDQDTLKSELLGLSPEEVRWKLGQPRVDYAGDDLWQYNLPTTDPRTRKVSRYVYVHFVFSRTQGRYGVDVVWFQDRQLPGY